MVVFVSPAHDSVGEEVEQGVASQSAHRQRDEELHRVLVELPKWMNAWMTGKDDLMCE